MQAVDGAVPGVRTAPQVTSVLRVHLDRVHDAVRRSGCGPDAAVEVVQDSGLDLVDSLAVQPQSVPDPVGWWFRRALEVAERSRPDGEGAQMLVGRGPLAADEEEQRLLAVALERQPQPGRLALLLRDSYDLPASAVAVVLGTDEDEAMRQVAQARLAFLESVETDPVPPLAGHATDLAALGRLGEGGPVRAGDATTFRHARSCTRCRAVVDGQDVARRLLAGLTVVAMPDPQRDAVLGALETRARHLLPAVAALRADDPPPGAAAGPDRRSLLRPVPVVAGVLLAAAVGGGAGLLMPRTRGAVDVAAALAAAPPLVSAAPAPTPVTVPTPAPDAARPRPTVFTLPPSPPPAPRPPASAPPTPTAAARAPAVTVTPAKGPNGATVQVTGSGWPPGTAVQLDYLDPTGASTGSGAVATADQGGRFRTALAAADPTNLPGRHLVRVSDGTRTAEGGYDATA